MKYFIKFVGLKNRYITVRAGNKTQAIGNVSKYRNDAIAYSEDELVFSFEAAEQFATTWWPVNIEELDNRFSNTQKNFKVTFVDGKVDYFNMRDDQFEAMLRTYHPKGNFFSTQGERFFTVKKGKEVVPICSIKVVRTIPNRLENKENKNITEV